MTHTSPASLEYNRYGDGPNRPSTLERLTRERIADTNQLPTFPSRAVASSPALGPDSPQYDTQCFANLMC